MILYEGEITTAIQTQQSQHMLMPGSSANNAPLQLQGRLSFDELGERQKERRTGVICDEFQKFSQHLPLTGLELVSLQFNRVLSHKTLTINIQRCRMLTRHRHLLGDSHETTTSDTDRIAMIARLMITYGVSYECYHELRQLEKGLPPVYKIKQYRADLPIPQIKKTPGEFEGAQFDFKDLLEIRLEEEVMRYPDYYKNESQHVRIRISLDGARFSRASSYCLLSFAFLRKNDFSLSPADLCTIAAIKGDETYEQLSVGFKNVFDDINQYLENPLFTTEEGNKYSLEFFLCADYKALLTIMGLKGASSNYACLWCTIHKDDRCNMELELPTEDVQFRSLEDFDGSGEFCSKHLPLINIEPDHIVPDELHMMLRITDTLIECLISTAIAYDKQYHHTHRTSRRAYKILEGAMIQKLLASINDCGVVFKMWHDKDDSDKDKKLNWTSLMGPDKLKLLKLLPDKLQDCQPDDMASHVADLWKEFNKLYKMISSSNVNNSEGNLKEKGKEWVKKFRSLEKEPYSDGYQPNKITPYLHMVVHHFWYFIEKYDNVKQFSCQGVEKNNDAAKKTFFKNSNRWDGASDIIRNLYQRHLLRNRKRKVQDYSKKDPTWWNGGQQQKMAKRRRISHHSSGHNMTETTPEQMTETMSDSS
ncbi:uncharacterized protein [Dysidea avara]